MASLMGYPFRTLGGLNLQIGLLCNASRWNASGTCRGPSSAWASWRLIPSPWRMATSWSLESARTFQWQGSNCWQIKISTVKGVERGGGDTIGGAGRTAKLDHVALYCILSYSAHIYIYIYIYLDIERIYLYIFCLSETLDRTLLACPKLTQMVRTTTTPSSPGASPWNPPRSRMPW